MVADRGVTGCPLLKSVGTQYAAVSPRRRHVVAPAARRDSSVDDALVVLFPKYVWSCDRPGCAGKTIRSSVLRWLNWQRTTKARPPLPCPPPPRPLVEAMLAAVTTPAAAKTSRASGARRLITVPAHPARRPRARPRDGAGPP